MARRNGHPRGRPTRRRMVDNARQADVHRTSNGTREMRASQDRSRRTFDREIAFQRRTNALHPEPCVRAHESNPFDSHGRSILACTYTPKVDIRSVASGTQTRGNQPPHSKSAWTPGDWVQKRKTTGESKAQDRSTGLGGVSWQTSFPDLTWRTNARLPFSENGILGIKGPKNQRAFRTQPGSSPSRPSACLPRQWRYFPKASCNDPNGLRGLLQLPAGSSDTPCTSRK